MKKLNKDYIGLSISHATLRTEDLIESFEVFLQLNHKIAWYKALNEKKNYKSEFWNTPQDEWNEQQMDESSWYLNEFLFDLLNEIAPDGTYFGSHEGNGSDFGFWLMANCYPDYVAAAEDIDYILKDSCYDRSDLNIVKKEGYYVIEDSEGNIIEWY